MSVDHVEKDSAFPYGDSIPECGYMLIYGADLIDLKKDSNGEAWADDMKLPHWHICTDNFSDYLETFGEIKDYDVIAVCNQYIKPGNYNEPKQPKNKTRGKRKPVGFSGQPKNA